VIKQDADATVKEVIATITEIAPRIPKTMMEMGETFTSLMKGIDELEQVETDRDGQVVIDRHLALLRNLRGHLLALVHEFDRRNPGAKGAPVHLTSDPNTSPGRA
jgi:hypothetical protein